MEIRLKFCGAARTVTGLCLLFETERARFLVDCGMFQGPKTLKALNHEPFPFDPRGLDAVLLTHAHIDHSGLLPRLVREGFAGRIHATAATRDLCSVMLPDSGHIQRSEVEQLNRRNRRRGRAPVAPIYTAEDAEAAMAAFETVGYGEWIAPAPGLRARWWRAGHMLGSASIELEFEGRPAAMRVFVSGDIGPASDPLHGEAEGPSGGIDHLVIESTYGDRDRPEITREERRAALAGLVRAASRQDGALLIPVFAVERAQEVVLDLVTLMREGQAPPGPIHLDSPLATRATRVFGRHVQTLEDAEAMRAALRDPLLRHVEDWEASRRLSQEDGFRIVLAGSGMCEAGRIRAHLKARLWDARHIVALVGFQATGTLGRLLQDGTPLVRIQGDSIKVAARITRIEGYSGHADAPELERWAQARGRAAGGVFVVHGEEEAMTALAARLERAGIAEAGAVLLPTLDEGFLLSPGAAPRRDEAAGRRRPHPEAVGQADWHNERAALLLEIEDALEHLEDEAGREAMIRRLRAALLRR